MLLGLCGSKTVQKILIFLFVNRKCYGTQLHRHLETPLTPIQKALSRLEKGGLITSEHEGKTKLYQFNPAFPLLTELEQLLKKTYTLLPAEEKKLFSSLPQRNSKKPGKDLSQQILLNFWENLSEVKHLFFRAKTRSVEENGWNGKGEGDVVVIKEKENALVFQEKGTWVSEKGHESSFSNTFRWTLDQKANLISLEHLRRGANHPVFLFHLSPTSDHSLSSLDSHLCGDDVYLGTIYQDNLSLRLKWRIIGPKKNEELDYHYT